MLLWPRSCFGGSCELGEFIPGDETLHGSRTFQICAEPPPRVNIRGRYLGFWVHRARGTPFNPTLGPRVTENLQVIEGLTPYEHYPPGATPTRPADESMSRQPQSAFKDNTWVLLMNCWNQSPTLRPKIPEVVIHLRTMRESLDASTEATSEV